MPNQEKKRPPTGWALAGLYGLFALVAMAANLLAQELSLRIYDGPWCIHASIVVGTGAGLVVKYLLDKRWIFAYVSSGLADDTARFLLYSLMGVATTLVFWGFELGFQWLFASKTMRYLGAVIGLTIGYLTKYHLDKHFVFKTGGSPPPA